MQGIYPVKFENAIIGEARITNEGLYYHISCSCSLQHSELYRLIVCGDRTKIDLGILVPEYGKYVVNKRIATKRMYDSDVVFYVRSRDHREHEEQITFRAEEPFARLSQLEKLKLNRQLDGSYTIVQRTET